MQFLRTIKNWFGGTSESTQNIGRDTANETNESVQNVKDNVSNIGVKTQTPSNWMKKTIPLVIILALGFWAVTYFSGTNPLSGLWKNTNGTMKHLEANIDGAVDAASNSAGTAEETISVAFTSFSLPNGESIEFADGSFGHNLTSHLESGNIKSSQVFTFDNLNFETGSAVLKEESIEQLNKLARILDAYSSVHIRIDGHTGNTGNSAANIMLSKQRAESAKQYLVTYANIDSKRIDTQGWGSEKPIASIDSEETNLQNRRTDLIITKK